MLNTAKEVYLFEGLGKEKTKTCRPGEICAVFGMENFDIGDTIADAVNPEGLSHIRLMNQQ